MSPLTDRHNQHIRDEHLSKSSVSGPGCGLVGTTGEGMAR